MSLFATHSKKLRRLCLNKNLKPQSERTKEEQSNIARMGGIASGKARKEKKLMSQIYADFLMKEHEITDKTGELKKISGQSLCNRVMSKVLSRGDSSSVRLLKEIREGTEGTKHNIVAEISSGKKRLLDYMDDEDVDHIASEIDE